MDNEFAAALCGALIGGVLSLTGGVFTTIFNERRAQVKAEQNVLHEVAKDLGQLMDANRRACSEDRISCLLAKSERKELMTKLHYASALLSSKRNARLATGLWNIDPDEDEPSADLVLMRELAIKGANPNLVKAIVDESKRNGG